MANAYALTVPVHGTFACDSTDDDLNKEVKSAGNM